MSKLIDLTGKQFGRLTVLERDPMLHKKGAYWICECDCGNRTIVSGSNLANGHTSSCGCLQREIAKEHATSHGLRNTRLYRTWAHMKYRCTNPNTINYSGYGGRGITICEEWDSFKPFAEWALSHGYADNLTIERIDNNKGYSPDNCKWITSFEQASNKRSNHLFSIDGKEDTMTNWARHFNINPMLVFSRLHRGWSEYEALTLPRGSKRCQSSE